MAGRWRINWKRPTWRRLPAGCAGAADIRAIVRLARLVRRERYDTVFSFLIHANVAAAMLSPFFRNVRFFQSIQTTQPYPKWHWKAQSIVRHAVPRRIVVPSESVAHAAQQWANVPADDIAIISNAIDPGDFDAILDETTLEKLIAGNPIPIGFIGRLDPISALGISSRRRANWPAASTCTFSGKGANTLVSNSKSPN